VCFGQLAGCSFRGLFATFLVVELAKHVVTPLRKDGGEEIAFGGFEVTRRERLFHDIGDAGSYDIEARWVGLGFCRGQTEEATGFCVEVHR
jgi:predicted small integral membrane protein